MENSNKLIDEVDTILFADETKFSINNGDLEDAIFYFGIAVNKNNIAAIDTDLTEILNTHKYQGKIFHSTIIFKEKRPRLSLMNDIAELFLKYKLHCFCYKYSKTELFGTSQILNSFNNDILDFKNQEFQALFYFLIFLNTNLRDNPQLNFGLKFLMYFDRNVYGKVEVEGFTFPDERFVIKRMTFSEKSQISLLALPDFFGYLFRKAKISKNKSDQNEKNTETSKLSINCYSSLVKMAEAKLFHFMNIEDEAKIMQQMFKLDTTSSKIGSANSEA